MTTIKITEARKEGELRWDIVLIDKENRPILQSTERLSRGTAQAVAKCLKHRVSDNPAQMVSADDELQFELIRETKFQLLDDGQRMSVLDVVKDLLVEAEIRWDPPDADPACKEKQADRTPTKGIPGS